MLFHKVHTTSFLFYHQPTPDLYTLGCLDNPLQYSVPPSHCVLLPSKSLFKVQHWSNKITSLLQLLNVALALSHIHLIASKGSNSSVPANFTITFQLSAILDCHLCQHSVCPYSYLLPLWHPVLSLCCAKNRVLCHTGTVKTNMWTMTLKFLAHVEIVRISLSTDLELHPFSSADCTAMNCMHSYLFFRLVPNLWITTDIWFVQQLMK